MKPASYDSLIGLVVCLGLHSGHTAEVDPPFSGTIFVESGILTESDPTSLESIEGAGRESRRMFDRRVNGRIAVDAFLFEARFDDGLSFEVQVNPEFGDAEAACAEAEKYAKVIGRMPTELRKDVETVSIHQGVRPFGGGNNGLLIHTGQADRYVASGILEETLIHEAAHTSLDARHARSREWRAAQEADGRFISNYARDHPIREDIAESYLLYLALRYRPDRIPQSLADTIVETIPNRIAYFDEQDFAMHPVVAARPAAPENRGEPADGK